MKSIFDRFKRKGVKYRTKLIGFFLLSTAISTLVGLYNYTSSRQLMEDVIGVLNKTQGLTAVYGDLDQVQSSLETYLSDNMRVSYEKYYDNVNLITESNNVLKKTSNYSERGVKIKNLTNMVENYLQVVDGTILSSKKENTAETKDKYQQTVKEYSYIVSYVKEIMSSDLTESSERYIQIEKSINHITILNNLLIMMSVILITIMIIVFSIQITKPLSKLASYAREVSQGNFEVTVVDDRSSIEMNILYRAFQKMTISIKEYVDALTEKQKLERTLNEEKLNNLKMKNALREAELFALQSQVNPHFIFNTINIGAKIAMLQGDDVTCNYLENAADIFRYNLKGLDFNATLRDEVQNVDSYMNLLKTRFGDVIDFRLNVEDNPYLQGFILPRMTLQPLIENAYIHGVSKFEDGGIIELNVKQVDDNVEILISNTGMGLTDEMIELILSRKIKNRENRMKTGHTTGIGIDNVLKRLRLFYGKKDVMNINCYNNRTNFILTLPLNKVTKGLRLTTINEQDDIIDRE